MGLGSGPPWGEGATQGQQTAQGGRGDWLRVKNCVLVGADWLRVKIYTFAFGCWVPWGECAAAQARACAQGLVQRKALCHKGVHKLHKCTSVFANYPVAPWVVVVVLACNARSLLLLL